LIFLRRLRGNIAGCVRIQDRGGGRGIRGPLERLTPLPVATREAFTDFAISKPWLFQPLAWTRTHRKLLYPDHGERYPIAARIVNTKTGGEFILIPESVARSPAGLEVLKRMQIDITSDSARMRQGHRVRAIPVRAPAE
jgi:hypothetical protein